MTDTSGDANSQPASPAVVFCGGGSGGHLFPGLAVADELRQRVSALRAVFVGSDRPIERDVLGTREYEHHALQVLTSGDLFRRPVRFFLAHRRATRLSTQLLQNLSGTVVVGLGGFASVPVVVAAARLGTPVVLLEQNSVAGRATRFLRRRARKICSSFPEALTGARCIETGNPVSQAISALFEHPRSNATDGLQLLILGGSQGARRLNEMVLAALSEGTLRRPGLRVVHQTGPTDEDSVRCWYRERGVDARVSAFLSDMPSEYAAADLLVSRAGATTLAEAACAGLPTVLVPYPQAVGDHQRRNADHYVRHGAAIVVEHGENAEDRLQAALEELRDPLRRDALATNMRQLARPDAAARVADVILQLMPRE